MSIEEKSTSLEKRVKDFTIPKLATPLSLDEYFHDHLKSVHEAILFLTRFQNDNETISSIVSAYEANPDKFSSDFSVDSLVREAGVDAGEFRRLIISVIDFLTFDDALISSMLSRGTLVRTSLAVANDPSLPESYQERQKWLEYWGFRLANKNSQVISVNVNQSTVNQQVASNGLPSFSSTIQEAEKTTNQKIKTLIDKSKTIDLSKKESIYEPTES